MLIEIVNGDKKIIEVTVTDSNGNPFDITDYDVYFSVKKRISDTTYQIQKSTVSGGIVKTDAVNGKFEITLLSADTLNMPKGDYVFDVEIREIATGEPYTVIKPSKFRIIKGVTE